MTAPVNRPPVLDLNADLAEGFGAWSLTDDDALLEGVTSANVACGFHAGDPRDDAAGVRAGGRSGRAYRGSGRLPQAARGALRHRGPPRGACARHGDTPAAVAHARAVADALAAVGVTVAAFA